MEYMKELRNKIHLAKYHNSKLTHLVAFSDRLVFNICVSDHYICMCTYA